jgi:lipopolysaccharide transport system ATP-binding protein
MSDIAIRVDKLSKRYRIGQSIDRSNGRKSLLQTAASPFRYLASTLREPAPDEIIWALKDVSFEVKRGEVLGIIGRNGAGKSTLLKILSRITEPTQGRAEIHGRVGSLLEVGTGFHPELTGRENIYLSGAILGMRKVEIDRKFDEIVAFAEVEKFINTPVKRYSSGMYVRLAFAVAAHLEPEILLVDEVLAVGDMAFQKKCLGKMGNVAREGRTVLFVSHNMYTISSLCPSTILLRNGGVANQGASTQVIGQYLSSDSEKSAKAFWPFEEAPGSDIAKLRSVSVLNEENEVCFDMWMNEPITVKVEFWILTKARVDISLHIFDQYGNCLFVTGNFHDPGWRGVEHEPGHYVCSVTIPRHYLNEGQHFVKIVIHHDDTHVVDLKMPEVISFYVHDPGDTRAGWTGAWIGLVRPILPWTAQRKGDLS